MLPLSLLRAAETQNILVELKNGDTYNGKLVNCDNFMNINLKEIVLTSSDGDSFWKIDECYIRGNTIKYLRVDPEVIDKVDEIEAQNRKKNGPSYRGRGSSRGDFRGSSRGEFRGRGSDSRGRGSDLRGRGGDSRGRGVDSRGRGGDSRGRGRGNGDSDRGKNSKRGNSYQKPDNS